MCTHYVLRFVCIVPTDPHACPTINHTKLPTGHGKSKKSLHISTTLWMLGKMMDTTFEVFFEKDLPVVLEANSLGKIQGMLDFFLLQTWKLILSFTEAKGKWAVLKLSGRRWEKELLEDSMQNEFNNYSQCLRSPPSVKQLCIFKRRGDR